MASPAAIVQRCGSCGYRRASGPCPECGSATKFLTPWDAQDARRSVVQMIKYASVPWLLPPMFLLIGWLALPAGSFGLLLIGVLGLALIVPAAAIVLAIGIAWHWTPAMLQIIWTWCNGEIGPWSGRASRASVFTALLLIQLLISGAIMTAAILCYPAYPAGWR
jgi:hypothetical protein